MPIYEDENTTRADLVKIRRHNKCQECGGGLDMYYDFDQHKAYLACGLDQTHEGIERESSRYEKEGLASLNLETRREMLEQEHGEAKTRALDKYMGGGVITKRIATEIVETLWGAAPAVEKTKCILLCQTYQLNPLMKHIYLIGYKKKINGKVVVDGSGNPILDWSIQMGIGATRLMAQRKHNYSYLDMTPRKATKAEIEKILGDTADPGCIYGFTHIKDVATGAEAYGLRGIKRTDNIKGQEKGNTHLNLACIRSERLALDRQYPGEMPPNIEVVDERFIDVDHRVVDVNTGEITEHTSLAEETAPPPEASEEKHICELHNCDFELKNGKHGLFYSHKIEGTREWCNEKKKKEAPAKAETAPEPVPETVEGEFAEVPGVQQSKETVGESAAGNKAPLAQLQESVTLCNWDYKMVQDYAKAQDWGVTLLSELKPEHLQELIKHINHNPK